MRAMRLESADDAPSCRGRRRYLAEQFDHFQQGLELVRRAYRLPIKNILATLLLSLGTATLLAGDEFARTQGGNNNAYCQDNDIRWLDWNIGDKGKSLIDFVQEVIALRQKYPALRRSRFPNGVPDEKTGIKDVAWVKAAGVEMGEEYWSDGLMRCFGMQLDGRALATGVRRPAEDVSCCLS